MKNKGETVKNNTDKWKMLKQDEKQWKNMENDKIKQWKNIIYRIRNIVFIYTQQENGMMHNVTNQEDTFAKDRP